MDLRHAYDLRASDVVLPSIVPRVGILVGNTRAMWDAFLAEGDLADPDPLDRFVERHLDGPGVVFAHRQYTVGAAGSTERAFLPFMRVAIASGFAVVSPCGLLVHPIYGPWFALRAIIPASEAPARAPIEKPCVCEAACYEPSSIETRAACSIGRAYRYSDAQLAFHYRRHHGG